MAKGLTEAQSVLLERVVGTRSLGLAVRPSDVKVAGELSAQDLLKHRFCSRSGRYRLYATPAGRAALSGHGGEGGER